MTSGAIEVAADLNALAAAAAERIVRLAEDSIARRGSFSIALSGGSTPKTLFELLANDGYSARIGWQFWRVYFGDERCVGPEHRDSNYRMARQSLLDRVPIPPGSIHRMKGEMDPQQAAAEYGQLLKADFGEGGVDLILLGMGDDGHTASLFPHTAALGETHHRCVANFVEKLGVWRITMTAPFINRAGQIIVMVSGAGKAQRLRQVLDGPRDTQNLPIQLIEPASGQLLWMLDAAAASWQKTA